MYFLINALLQVLIYLVCYYFSPEVFAISDIISPFLSFIVKIFEGSSSNVVNIIFNCIGYLIIIFASFIYNEIIVCNFWHLNENTWKAIVKKANADYDGSLDRLSSFSIGGYRIDNITNRHSSCITELSSSINNDSIL